MLKYINLQKRNDRNHAQKYWFIKKETTETTLKNIDLQNRNNKNRNMKINT